MKIRFIDFEAFKYTIKRLMGLIDGKADKEHQHSVDDVITDESNQFISKAEREKLAGIEENAEVNNISDADALELTSGTNTDLHYHESDRDRSNHTGTQPISSIENLQPTLQEIQKNIYTKASIDYVNTNLQNLIDDAPEILNTLGKLANAIENNPAFSHTIKNLLNEKVDKVEGKQLSTNDYTTEEKEKLAGIENKANYYVHPDIHNADIIVETELKRFVSDEEKEYWNNKADLLDIQSLLNDYTGIPPETLNTLEKIANAIGNDKDFITTVTIKIDSKVDKIDGMGLSSNDFTTYEKNKLAGIEEGANNYIHPDNSNIRHVTDKEKELWNLKASTNYVDEQIAKLVNSAPETLDTLYELAQALNNDPNFATTIANQIGKKVDKEVGKGLSTNDYTDMDKSKVDIINVNGDGSRYLADDGTYKIIEISDNNASIDDDNISTSTTYSSSKINAELAKKADLNHAHTEFHSHENKQILDGITLEKMDNWDMKTSLLVTDGDGVKFLSNDGTYKEISGGTIDLEICTEEDITEIINVVFNKE